MSRERINVSLTEQGLIWSNFCQGSMFVSFVLGLLVSFAPRDSKEDGRVGSGFFDDESL